MLIAVEGWYHYVESEPCTLAMNIWLEGPVASLLKRSPGMSYYMLRASMHECVQQQVKATSSKQTNKRLQSTQPSSSSSSSTNNVNNKKRMRSNRSDCSGDADEAEKGSAGVSSYEDFRSLFNRLIVSQVTPTPPPHRHLSDDEHSLVNMSYTDMLLYWPGIAQEAPIQWYNMLYNLSPQAVYLLTTHWDEVEKEEVCGEDGQKELSAFFEAILHPPPHIQQTGVSSSRSSGSSNSSASGKSANDISSPDTGIEVSICYLYYTLTIYNVSIIYVQLLI